MSKLPYIVTFLSSQGGSGQTTACINTAATLSMMGKRVLLVDARGDALHALNVPTKRAAYTMATIRPKDFVCYSASSNLAVYHHVCNTSLAFETLFGYLVGKPRRRYDYVFIDSGCDRAPLPVTLACANRAIITYNLHGHDPKHLLRESITSITAAKQRGNVQLDFDIFATQYEPTWRLPPQSWNALLECYGPAVFPAYTYSADAELKASLFGQALATRYPAHKNAHVYRQLANKLFFATPPTIYRSDSHQKIQRAIERKLHLIGSSDA